MVDGQLRARGIQDEGLLQAMTENEARDLLAYLKSPNQVPLPPEK